jgi:hypothetical protein
LPPVLAALNVNGKNVPAARRFHISIRKTPVLSSGAELAEAFGTANEQFAPVVPVSTTIKVRMDDYHPLVPSQFRDLTWGVQPKFWRILVTWLMDLILVGTLAAVLCSGAATTADFVGFMVFLILLLPWVYGFCRAGGNSVGTLLVGTQIIRLRNAKAPGFWRGGWMMFYRIVLA